MVVKQIVERATVPSGVQVGSLDAEAFNQALELVMHEVRTPLTALHASLDLLVSQVSSLDPVDVRAMLARMQRSLAWIHGMIENLGTYARLQTGRLELRRAPVDLLGSIEAMLVLLQPVLDRKGQRVRLICPPPEIVVSGDRQMIEQVLLNLLTNANKYSYPDDVIEVEVRVDEAGVRVSVTDHGPGIAREHHSRIFSPYARVDDGTTGDIRGLGLGLFIVKTLVELHGGTVGVTSAPGCGASFWCTFPEPVATGPESRADARPWREWKLEEPVALALVGAAAMNLAEDTR